MSSVGAQLRQAREQQRLSRADVTRDIKIQTWVLEAIEEDRLPEMMSPIYVKGFIGSYAKFLRLEPEPLVAQLVWPAATAGGPSAATAEPPKVMETVAALASPLMKHLRTAALLSAAVLLLVFAARPLQRVIAKLPSAALAKGRVTIASVTSGDKILKPPALPTLTLMATQPLELDVTAQANTWVTIRADGKLIAQQRMIRGARERWSAKKELEIIVAQPSAVELSLNGQTISPFAVAHRGRLLITHRGVTQLRSDLP